MGDHRSPEIGRVVDIDLQRDRRVVGMDALQQRREPSMAHCLDGAEAKHAVQCGRGADPADHIGAQLQHLLGEGQELDALCSERGAPLLALEEADAELLLKHRYARGDRGLGRVQLLRGEAEPAEPGDPDESFDVAQIQHRVRRAQSVAEPPQPRDKSILSISSKGTTQVSKALSPETVGFEAEGSFPARPSRESFYELFKWPA